MCLVRDDLYEADLCEDDWVCWVRGGHVLDKRGLCVLGKGWSQSLYDFQTPFRICELKVEQK